MSRELLRRGFYVDVFTTDIGEFSRQFECAVTDDVENLDDEYDLILVNHKTCWEEIRGIGGTKVYTSHSVVIDELEGFPDDASIRVAVSEEIAKARGGAKVINNGIDLRGYRSMRPAIGNKVLYLGKAYETKTFDVIRQACKGMDLTISGHRAVTPKIINDHDVVIGYGRAVLEGLACERKVISADCRPYVSEDKVIGGGMVSRQNFDELKLHNFTGRGNPIAFTPETLRAEIEKPFESLRDRVEEFNVIRVVDHYLGFLDNYLTEEGYYA